MNFSISDKVVCIDDQFPVEALALLSGLPIKGQVYVVREVYVNPRGKIGLKLAGIFGDWCTTRHAEFCFRAERFRKLADVKAENAQRQHEPALC